MRKTSRLLSITMLVLSITSIIGCSRRSDTINNGQVLVTPYSLYYTDTSGALYNTNDGKTNKVIFPSDGRPTRAICTDGTNILIAKPSLFISTNNGVNFNYSYANSDLNTVSFLDVNNNNVDLNQSMILNIPSWVHTYVSSRVPSNPFGLSWTALGGALNTWYVEVYYDTDQMTTTPSSTITSMTYTKKGILAAYDGNNQLIYFRGSLQDRWKYTPKGANVLPAAPPPMSNSGAWFSIGHLNEQLIAIDAIGNNGAYYSNDYGANWLPFSGLPAATPLLCVASPFEELCYVGTDGKGLYMLNTNTGNFQQVGGGLPANLSVRGIVQKENIYKNGTKKRFVYITTNQGLYQSEDMGINWVRTIQGNLVNIY